MQITSRGKTIELSAISAFVDGVHAREPELLAIFDDERKGRPVNPSRAWVAGFGYPDRASYVHFFYLSAQSLCARWIHHGTFWRDLEGEQDRVCGDCFEILMELMK